MFGRQSKTLQEQQSEEVTKAPREGAKNRPTPKRRDQEAARKRPLVVTDRKAARDLERTKRREAQVRQRTAMMTGDEANLPAKDKGPVRRYIRDYVDARWNLGEFMLPVMFVVLALSFIRNPTIFLFVSTSMYVILVVAIVDAFIMWRGLKKRLRTAFGDDQALRGLSMYAVMRGFQLRRSRMPRPQVARGQYPSA